MSGQRDKKRAANAKLPSFAATESPAEMSTRLNGVGRRKCARRKKTRLYFCRAHSSKNADLRVLDR
jgi:hypothetical protein